MKLFDSHAHYNDEAFGSKEERYALLKELSEVENVKYILCAGTNPDTSKECLKIAHDHDGIFASRGACLDERRALYEYPETGDERYNTSRIQRYA